MTARLSLQLYTLREQTSAGIRDVLDQVANIGFAGVEPAGFGDLDATAFRTHVEDLGMTVSSSHIPLPPTDKVDQVLDAQAGLGATTLVVAYLPPEQFASAEAVSRTAEQLNVFNEAVRARGCTLGYHNHWFEFEQAVNGKPAYLALFDQLERSIIAEVDTYWVRTGGGDPVAVINALGARASLLHIKDGPADDPKSDMVAAGDGIMDIAAIAGASEADWHVVELDRCATDMMTAVATSATYLLENGLATGRQG